jgi:Arc/MetJ family transcription regulator
MGLRKTTISIDDDLVGQVSAILGTRGLTDTVGEALRHVIVEEARERMMRRLETMEGLDLNQPEIMAGAWRE